MKINKTFTAHVHCIKKGMNHSACLQLTSDTLQLNLDTRHKIFGKNFQLIDFITMRKESGFFTTSKVIMICAAFCTFDKLRNVKAKIT